MKTTKTKTVDDTERQLDFFFWLGSEGELKSASEEEFEQEQENWDGQRP